MRAVVALSTDKAAAPINLYGATKLCSDKLFTAANNIRGGRELKFAVVRYGNVMGSRGSVIPFFLACRDQRRLADYRSAHDTLQHLAPGRRGHGALGASSTVRGGEIFVPKIPSYRIMDVAEAIAPAASTGLSGVRPGEKVHEEMITASDSLNTVDLGPYFAILPSAGGP